MAAANYMAERTQFFGQHAGWQARVGTDLERQRRAGAIVPHGQRAGVGFHAGSPPVPVNLQAVKTVGGHALWRQIAGGKGGEQAILPHQLGECQVAGAQSVAVYLGVEGCGIPTAGERQHGVEVVHHQEMERIFARVQVRGRRGAMAGTGEVHEAPATQDFRLERPELAVEEQDVAHHAVVRVRRHEPDQLSGLGERPCQRLLDQYGEPRREQRPGN